MDRSTPDDTATTDAATAATASTTATGRRRRLVILVVAAVVVAVLVVAAVLASRGGADGGTGPGGADLDAPAPVTSQDPADGQAPPAEAPAVGLDATAQPVPGVDVSIDELRAVEGVADGAGEIAGPALSFVVTVANGTDAPVSLAAAVVTVASGADLLPADPLRTGSTPLPAEVPAGGTATATYVFTVPVERRDDVRIAYDHRAGTPAVVFSGQAPRP
ncbi:hypothetical protein [Clavibacter tessellarius]|uniref:DUF4352 domain-containing protein n=1 Tax=Clavibacter tessellarius TaxID=31965 RepID=A0A154V545_9MICO|nr:hypothetical protein [Clavibacter michiganensis]KZC96490.1 hypothetical protein AWH51_02740 [Clavibacter michiganensis subsp. tessellarius]